MWIADKWKDYEVLDSSDGEKLERWGRFKLLRPDPQVIWSIKKDPSLWGKLNAHYHRSDRGGGEWEFFDLPETWQITYREAVFNLKPFSFKHTGLFPEQAVNWDWMRGVIRTALDRDGDRRIKVLNLFAYTGGATIAPALEGAPARASHTANDAGHAFPARGAEAGTPGEAFRVSVTHVDASKGMVTWAKENAHASGLESAPIRYITDDCKKFVEREIRRGNRYDAIIMDPPSYGRGPGGEIWKLEESLHPFVKLCAELLTDDPLFVLINSYTTGLQPAVLSYLLNLEFAKRFGGSVSADEIGLPVTHGGFVLPCGASGRWVR
ncbi:MAG: SAM-dependent methyltransferase [Lachnospiraceae bacterium]|nr:SAM-dependent methyltransferase [Lachnospiraceae bacterium]